MRMCSIVAVIGFVASVTLIQAKLQGPQSVQANQPSRGAMSSPSVRSSHTRMTPECRKSITRGTEWWNATGGPEPLALVPTLNAVREPKIRREMRHIK